jgi:hypothetical protein
MTEEEEYYLYADYVSDENCMVGMKVMKIMWWGNESNAVWGVELVLLFFRRLESSSEYNHLYLYNTM